MTKNEHIARFLSDSFYITSDEEDYSWDELPQWHRDRFLEVADAVVTIVKLKHEDHQEQD